MGELLEYSRTQADQGRRRLVVDMAAVSRCDGDGLTGLEELVAGWCGIPVNVVGARWSQFLPALLAVDNECLTTERERVRALVAPSGAQTASTTPSR
ncbi:MAG TPA: hypothetical protein VGH76_18795 [Actinomycetospora sp.]|uniref:hypothetical protein n=1 Tax=Actinomycetospora sp. TaxID=1872135 RepID=UPI002F3E2A6E